MKIEIYKGSLVDLAASGCGDGYSFGYDYGYGCGDGYGFGCGYGYGHGYGYGYCHGDKIEPTDWIEEIKTNKESKNE